MRHPITLTDDGELTEAVDVSDRSAGGMIHFTTGREANYPAATTLVKGKRRRPRIFDGNWVAWLLVIFCIWALFTIFLLITIRL